MSIGIFYKTDQINEESAFISSYKQHLKELFKKHVEVLKNLKEGDKLIFSFDGELKAENSYRFVRSFYSLSQSLYNKEKQDSRNIVDLLHAVKATIDYYESRFLSSRDTETLFNDLTAYQKGLGILKKTYNELGKTANVQVIQDAVKETEILQGRIIAKKEEKAKLSFHEFIAIKMDDYAQSYQREISKHPKQRVTIYLEYIHKISELFLIEPEDISNFIHNPCETESENFKKRMAKVQNFMKHLKVGKSQFSQAFIISKLYFDLLVKDADRLWDKMRNCHISMKDFEILKEKIDRLPQDSNIEIVQKRLLIEAGFPEEQIY